MSNSRRPRPLLKSSVARFDPVPLDLPSRCVGPSLSDSSGTGCLQPPSYVAVGLCPCECDDHDEDNPPGPVVYLHRVCARHLWAAEQALRQTAPDPEDVWSMPVAVLRANWPEFVAAVKPAPIMTLMSQQDALRAQRRRGGAL